MACPGLRVVPRGVGAPILRDPVDHNPSELEAYDTKSVLSWARERSAGKGFQVSSCEHEGRFHRSRYASRSALSGLKVNVGCIVAMLEAHAWDARSRVVRT
jgi:hypothetical protein